MRSLSLTPAALLALASLAAPDHAAAQAPAAPPAEAIANPTNPAPLTPPTPPTATEPLRLAPGQPLRLDRGLWIDGLADSGRRLVNLDAIVARLTTGNLAPSEGDTIEAPWRRDANTRAWKTIAAGADGQFASARGYLAVTVTADAPAIAMLVARGHALVYVNGEPRQGDPYGHGYVRLPVALRTGHNTLLFATAGRGPLIASLEPARAPLELLAADLTRPDIIRGQAGPWLLGLPVINASASPREAFLRARIAGATAATAWGPAAPVRLAPLGLAKTSVALDIRPSDVPAAPDTKPELPIEIGVFESATATSALDTAATTLAIRDAHQTHKRTFVSEIDASLQYYAVVPPKPAAPGDAAPPGPATTRPALVLSLHGAGVEASGQAASYAAKPDIVIACPTNRRQFGFDWEDWGRKDALEVLDIASAAFHADPARTFLTGHSMGGHGTWNIGALLPHIFSAVAPSAGWLSFETYGGPVRFPGTSAESEPLAAMLRRASASSDTPALMPNFAGRGVYILHGDADDNVPVREARSAKDLLTTHNIPFGYHEQPGAGHWWDDDRPGAACLDWPPIFDMFAAQPPTDPRPQSAALRLLHPGPAARQDAAPLVIEDQLQTGMLSTLDAEIDGEAHLSLRATNVRRFTVGPVMYGARQPRSISVNGQRLELPPPARSSITLASDGQAWYIDGSVTGTRSPFRKSAQFPGGFKSAFDHRFTLVYGTQGTPDENAWMLAKARFDAEQWWYRGNGRAEVLSDAEALGRGLGSGNIILYGHRSANSLWPILLANSPVDADRGIITVGKTALTGDDLHAFFLRPVALPNGSPFLVGAVAATGRAGMIAADRYPIFSSGVGMPDVLVLRASAWTQGLPGLLCAGYFDHAWNLPGDLVWSSAIPRPEPK